MIPQGQYLNALHLLAVTVDWKTVRLFVTFSKCLHSSDVERAIIFFLGIWNRYFP